MGASQGMVLAICDWFAPKIDTFLPFNYTHLWINAAVIKSLLGAATKLSSSNKPTFT